tara:strand:- start:437 stop:1024 length:588 start_codon:yes stop_codon:yes gene_type:complete
MIVYLGMPKCASTWLYNKIIHNFEYIGEKEPHTLVEWGETNNNIIDFSTNNWSMDSTTAEKLDKEVSHYIYIVRDPIELATSYYLQTTPGITFNDFVNSLINTKLLCFGDIIERWYNLVDRNKILVYNYNIDIQNNQKQFLENITKILNINYDTTILPKKKVFETVNKPTLTCDTKHKSKLDFQMNKFKKIVEKL